ncbi:MAG TPA: hypothetical protein DCY79_05995 [Planctomycetaceae bacterium]|nr:hypothetical protein [Blastopirellula sp.]HAY79343.1 hypothetical protein [Planctomycetaceae bacterium]
MCAGDRMAFVDDRTRLLLMHFVSTCWLLKRSGVAAGIIVATTNASFCICLASVPARENNMKRLLCLLFLLSFGIPRFVTASDSLKSAQLMPESTIVFAEIDSPKAIIDLVLKHPLREQVENLPEIRALLNGPQMEQAKLPLGLFEAQLGMHWDEAVAAITHGGLCVGVDRDMEGFVVLSQADKLQTLVKLRKFIFQLVPGASTENTPGNPVRKREYKGVKSYEIGGTTIAALGTTLLVTNKRALAERVMDLHLESGQECLATQPRFQAALQQRGEASAAWGYFDMVAMRDRETFAAMTAGKTDNIVAEFLLGGLLSTLQHTPYGVLNLEATAQRVAVSVSVPQDADWAGELREYYFGPGGKGSAPAPLQLEHTLFTVVAYRDMSQMWLRAGDLMTESANDDLAQADTQLTTFFSGKDFGEDILGSLGPQMQLIAVRQDLEDVLPRPAIKLPAFALVFQMKDPETTKREFRRVFQSFIGFLNVVGAMEGNPQFDLDMEQHGDAQLVTATYVPDQGEESSTKAKINFNFSPAVAFQGDRFVLSSTTQLARQIANIPKTQAAPTPGLNAAVRLHADALQRVLADNQAQLVAQNMLEEGNSKEEAEAAIGLLLQGMTFFRESSVKLGTTDGNLNLRLELQLAKEHPGE